MIIIAGSSTVPRTNIYCHHKDTVLSTTSLVVEGGDCCWCSCETIIPAFASLDVADEFDTDKNDFFSWILKVPTGSTVVATLTNLDSATDYIITDNTYGKYFDVDDLKANVWGFIIEWLLVADALGFGNYKLNITVTSVAAVEIFNKDYPTFALMPYTCNSAHGTVRIESHNSGYIEGGFDYRDISITTTSGIIATSEPYWKQQIRWYGRLQISALNLQTDNYSDNYRNLLQIQTQLENEYNLRLEFIPMNIGNQLIYDNLLADYLILNDYNADNVDEYRKIKVSLSGVDTPQPFRNKTVLFNLKFVPFKQNNLKRFY